MSDRTKAYAAIDSERNYQDRRWGQTLSSGRPGDGSRTVDEFILYAAGYMNDAVALGCRSDDTDAKLAALRKVAALCVACFEQHGCPLRESAA
jgi:hypothetical protein